MKIAYVSDVVYPFVKGGAEKRIYEISKRLVKRGHKVHVFGIKWWKTDWKIKMDGVFLHGVCPPVSLYVGGRRSVKEAILFSCTLLPHLLKDRFDIIDCSEFPIFPCYTTKLASITKKSPLIFTWYEVWKDYWYEYLGPMGIFGKAIERSTISLADRFIAVSNQTKHDLISMGVKEEKITVIPIGIDFYKIEKITPSREHFDVVFVGRLIKEKNIDALLYSIGLLKKKSPEIKVGIIGDGPERAYLQRLTEKIGIEKNVKFLGFLEDFDEVISIMKSSKVFVHPSTREGGASIVTLEANACGLPIVAIKHKLGISSELIKDGFNGFFLEKLSSQLMAEKVNLILENEKLKRKMQNNAKKFVRPYDWEKIVDLIEEVYEHI